MNIDKARLGQMLLSVARLWRENRPRLSEIDSRFGDGDHGVTIGKIAALIERSVAGWTDTGPAAFLSLLGEDIMEIGGGSASPLYGTLVGGLAGPAEGADEIDAPTLKRMFAASLEELSCLTTARVGDKTMMDAVIPAVAAAGEAADEIPAVPAAAARAAEEGATASENMVSKFGRARSYGDKTLGVPDAGAISSSLFFRGLAEG